MTLSKAVVMSGLGIGGMLRVGVSNGVLQLEFVVQLELRVISM